ncbi:MAG: hypothetical protein OXG76_05860 [Acidimicrobiaceae bacterium]|nr:hypothetical protein [Acidimicrobiaceae bacterium]
MADAARNASEQHDRAHHTDDVFQGRLADSMKRHRRILERLAGVPD